MDLDAFSDRAPAWLRFFVVVLIILCAFAIRMAIMPIQSGLQFLTFYPAIVLCFYICGAYAGLFSIFLSTFISYYVLFPPYFSFKPAYGSVVSTLVYVSCTLIIGYAISRMHTYRKRSIEAERNLAQNTKIAAEERLGLVVDGARLGVWRWNVWQDTLVWSDQCYRHFGIEPSSGMSYDKFISLLHPDDQKRIDDVVNHSLKEQQDYQAEYRTIWPDGSVHWIYALGRPYYLPSGELERMDGVLLDITDRMKAEEGLRKSEDRFRAFVLAGSNAIYRMSPDWTLMNRLDGKDFIADTTQPTQGWLQDHILPEDQPMVTAAINKAIEEKVPFEFEHRVIRKEGDVGWTHFRAVPILDKNGDIIEWFGSAADITLQRELQQDAQEAASLLTAAFDSITDLMMIVDDDGKITRTNDMFIRLCGFARPEDVPETVEALKPIIQVKSLEGAIVPFDQWPINRGIAGFRVEGAELQISRADNLANWIGSFSVSPIFGQSGEPHGAILLARNITIKKQQELELRQSLKQFSELAEAMPQIVWVTDAQGRNTYFNSHWVGYTGLSLEESAGHGWNIPLHPDDRMRAWEAWGKAVKHLGSYSLECRLRRKDGVYRWFLIRGVPVLNPTHEICRWYGTCTDINDIKDQEEAARRSSLYLQSAVSGMVDAVFLCDTDGKFILLNDSAIRFWRFEDREAVPETFDKVARLIEVTTFSGKKLTLHERPVNLALQGKKGVVEATFRRIDTGEEWLGRFSYAPMRNVDQEIIGATCSAIDITELKRQEREIVELNQNLETKILERTQELENTYELVKELSRHDPLTGLFNRISGDEILSSEFLRMKRTGQVYSVLMIDIDHFKKLNDSHGHLIGDEVLKSVAMIIKNSLRQTDTVYRFGGEEFVVILPSTHFQPAYEVAEKIRRAVATTPHETAGEVHVSIGVAEATADAVNEDVVVSHADEQLYAAKREGRNRIAPTGFDCGI